MKLFNKSRERDSRLKVKWVKRNSQYQVGGKFWCAYCGKWVAYKDMEVDHVVPFSKGGSDKDSNLVPSCMPCNRKKSDKSSPFYYISGKSYFMRFWIERAITITIKTYLVLIGIYYTVTEVIPMSFNTQEGKYFLITATLFALWKLDMNILLLKVSNSLLTKLWHFVLLMLGFALVASAITAFIMLN